MSISVAPTFERVIVSPQFAEQLLSVNDGNRKVKESHVNRLSQVIRNGEWQFNAQPIQIGADGRVLDGQHRLLACVRAELPIDVLLVRGAATQSQETMDMGVSRSVPDILALRGYKDVNSLAAFATRAIAYKKISLKEAMGGMTRNVTPGEVISFVEKFDGHHRYIREATATGHILRIPASIVGLSMYVLDHIDIDDSYFFWERLRTGSALLEGDAVYALRAWCLDPFRQTGNASRQSVIETYARIFKAWNKFRAGEPVMRLTYRPGGANPEQFPEPK